MLPIRRPRKKGTITCESWRKTTRDNVQEMGRLTNAGLGIAMVRATKKRRILAIILNCMLNWEKGTSRFYLMQCFI